MTAIRGKPTQILLMPVCNACLYRRWRELAARTKPVGGPTGEFEQVSETLISWTHHCRLTLSEGRLLTEPIPKKLIL